MNRNWTEDELIVALNLNYSINFGQYDKGNPKVIELANLIGRRPSSVAIRLSNYASLDPALKARGIKGLTGISKHAKEIWYSFHDINWELKTGSEMLIEKLKSGGRTEDIKEDYQHAYKIPEGPTEKISETKVRLGQRFFRKEVLWQYEYKCAISGLPLPELLNASHIKPWSKFPEIQLDLCNGICLAATYDRAFDRGLISFDDEYRLILSKDLLAYQRHESVQLGFIGFYGKQLNLPIHNEPSKEMLRYHRQAIFTG